MRERLDQAQPRFAVACASFQLGSGEGSGRGKRGAVHGDAIGQGKRRLCGY